MKHKTQRVMQIFIHFLILFKYQVQRTTKFYIYKSSKIHFKQNFVVLKKKFVIEKIRYKKSHFIYKFF